MRHLEKIIVALAIIALLGALVSTLHTYIDGERWAWYDAGYDDALEDMGVVIINGRAYLEDCPIGYTRNYTKGVE